MKRHIVLQIFMYTAILLGVLILIIYLPIPKAEETFASNEPKAYAVLVIDDFGNNGQGIDMILNLPIPITGAVIPGMPFTAEDAKRLYNAGKEVILHIPLEPERGKASWLGSSGILTSMDEEEIRNRIVGGLKEVNYAIGMNNHMGSKAMKDTKVVNAIIDIAKENDLFFLDSKTTDPILSRQLCQQKEVVLLERDVFLDNQKSVHSVKQQMNKLGDIAIEKGYGIAIGHVGQGGNLTAQGIKESIASLEEKGIQFITLKELIEKVIEVNK